MKTRMVYALLSVLLLLSLLSGCGGSGAESAPAGDIPTSSDGTWPAPVSGTYEGQTVTMRFRAITNYAFPIDMAGNIRFVSGRAVFYSWGTMEESSPQETWLCVDPDGNLITDEFEQPPSVEYADHTNSHSLEQDSNGHFAIVEQNTGNRIALPQDVISACFISDSVIRGISGDYINEQHRLYDLQGQCLTEFFEEIGTFENGMAPFFQNGKLGVLGDDGTIIVEPVYPIDFDYTYRLLYSEKLLVVSYKKRLSIIQIIHS